MLHHRTLQHELHHMDQVAAAVAAQLLLIGPALAHERYMICSRL
jgi:hypothetical protein